jgi:hypothetical protein
MDHYNIYDKALRKYFPDPKLRKEAEDILSGYGNKNEDKEAFRVKVAVLKLAECDMRQLKHYTLQACTDYRDVLCWAEYPSSYKWWSSKENNPEKYMSLQKEDLEQYKDWVRSL